MRCLGKESEHIILQGGIVINQEGILLPPATTKNPLISERAFGGVKWARTIDLYDVNVTL